MRKLSYDCQTVSKNPSETNHKMKQEMNEIINEEDDLTTSTISDQHKR